MEFALILPILLLTLFTLIELARILHAWMVVENGARFGIRYAVTGEYNPTNCAGGMVGKECALKTDESGARVDSIHDAAWAGSESIVRVHEGEVGPADSYYYRVIVCDPEELVKPSSTFDTHQCTPEDPGDPGDRVIVVIEFNHPLILPGLNSIWPTLRLQSQREAVVETFRMIESGATLEPQPSSTPIPSRTPPPTATNTPTPDCSDIRVKKHLHWDPDYDDVEIEFDVENKSNYDAHLIYSKLTITDTNQPKGPARLDNIHWDNKKSNIWDGYDYFRESPWRVTGLWLDFPAGEKMEWEADIDNVTKKIYWKVYVRLKFKIDGLSDECVVTSSLTSPSPPTKVPSDPKPTKTSGPPPAATNTPKATNTSAPTPTEGGPSD
ncbi:MAG: hypothetical protein GTO18_08305 [Anaerolineales bacterium]|nr:hypothetical protein [Anaerolineales bacterium]